eukprot:TRINITY_DN16728_c0_g1_i1.p2 TRINITY_DN16728_c0_g1~~TRINITY_DN16728_c0_g1_i1.p2  ORF type:complete len:161 (+),score=42.39 TRINITY_DN16728_c0_g1_i1:25-483(+)
MKIQLCNFSGYKIHPGHGKRFVRGDSKAFVFLNKRCEAAFLVKSNPRKTSWTQVYRRLHKKGTEVEIAKRRARRAKRVQRSVVGAPIEVIRAKANQSTEVRTAAREASLRQIKEKKKVARASKPKTTKTQQTRTAGKQKQQKGGKAGGKGGR